MVKPVANTQDAAQERMAAIKSAVAGIKPVGQQLGPFRGVFYARNKVGKTRFGATSGKRTLFIVTDPMGTETLDALNVPSVDTKQIQSWEEFDPIFWYLKTQDHPYEVVVIDTWTMLTTFCLRWVMNQETRLDPLKPQSDHWQKLAQVMNNEVLRWVFLPKVDLIFLCQERNFTAHLPEDENETVQMIGPATTPSVKDTLIGAVGTIGHLYIKRIEEGGKFKAQRRMRFFDPSQLYICGTRVRGLPNIMANPTLKAILDIRDKTGELPPDDTLIGVSYEVEEDEGEEVIEQEAPAEGSSSGVLAL